MQSTTLTVLAVVLAAWIWSNKNRLGFLSLSDFPEGYYSKGNWSSDCAPLRHNHDGHESDSFKYCEDATFWDQYDAEGKLHDRLILLSCDPGRKAWNTVMGPLLDPSPRGGLWLYSPENSAGPQRIAFAGYPKNHDFHPLGLEVWPSYGGNASTLFVINHASRRTVIEQFSLDPAKQTEARWVRTLSSKYFVSPNGLALTSPSSFYVTNDHLMTRRLPKPLGDILPVVESVLALPLSWTGHVTLHDDAESTTIEHAFTTYGVPFSNGVALSPDGKQLAIVSTSLGQVHFYARNPDTNALLPTHSVPIPFLADNITYDEEGNLIVAGHPHFPSLIGVAKNKTDAVAPSWVVSVSPREMTSTFPKEYDAHAPVSASIKAPPVLSHQVETLFQSNGKFWSTSTTGLQDSRTGVLYITGLYEDGLLVCKPRERRDK